MVKTYIQRCVIQWLVKLDKNTSYFSDERMSNRRALPQSVCIFLHVSCGEDGSLDCSIIQVYYCIHKYKCVPKRCRAAEALCHCSETWVWRGHSSGQSWYYGGHPRGGEAGACPHASLGVDASLSRVLRWGLARVHARTRAVRWWCWMWCSTVPREPILWWLWIVPILGTVQCLLVSWRWVYFRHDDTGPP